MPTMPAFASMHNPQPPTPNPADLAAHVPPWVDVLLRAVTRRYSSDSSEPSAASLDDVHSNRVSPTVTELAARAMATTGLPRIRHALAILRTHDPPALDVLASETDAHLSLIAMLSMYNMSSPSDKAAILVATHSLCSNKLFRQQFLEARGMQSLCAVVAPKPPSSVTDRVVGTGVFAVAERNSMHRLTSSSESEDTLFTATPDNSTSPAPPSHPDKSALPANLHRSVWNAAVRTIAKLMVCSVAACANSIETGALSILAKAAKPSEPMDIRLRAAAGLAAIAAWSGPRRAVEIVETDDVVLSMTSILTEQDERIPGDLRTATIDGLVVMSFRRHARRILQRYSCEEKIKAAARHATVSGDYTAAARSTVAAGQMSGRSIDEYGFLVEDNTPDENNPNCKENEGDEGKPIDNDGNSPSHGIKRKPTGLRQLEQRLLHEPYASVEDLNVLEEIVHEEAGLLSSSPRDRKYIRRAARTYGVSADQLEFVSALEDEPAQVNSPPDVSRKSSTPTASRKNSSHQRLALQPSSFAEGRESTQNPNRPISGKQDVQALERFGSGYNSALTGFSDGKGRSSPRRSSNFASLQDPDFDRLMRGTEEEETASNTTTSSKSKILPPLLMFSSATKKAAARDGKNSHLQKTSSQLSRETENERIWKEVIERRPEMLKRERGRSSRVVAYRELALVPVPPSMRRRLWPTLLDTKSLREARPGLYERLCVSGEGTTLPDDIEHTIDADVTRTMPLHSLFWAGGAQVGVQSLRSILRAYALYVPEVGYCQGMSSIAAVLLMNASDEEEAFLMMVQFMSRFQYKKVFAPGFPLMLQWIAELKPLVAHYMPELHEHLDRENVPLELYADKWLITALSHNFPHRHLLRVWDLMFLGGSPKIILKACLRVLKNCETTLLALSFETIMPFLQRGFAEADAKVLDPMDPEPFITKMREFRFMPDIPKSQLKNGTSSGGNSPERRNDRRRVRRGVSCLPCFRRSAVVE